MDCVRRIVKPDMRDPISGESLKEDEIIPIVGVRFCSKQEVEHCIQNHTSHVYGLLINFYSYHKYTGGVWLCRLWAGFGGKEAHTHAAGLVDSRRQCTCTIFLFCLA